MQAPKKNNTQDKIRDTQDQLGELKRAVDSISAQIGTGSVGNTNLSIQHNEIKSIINEKSEAQTTANEGQSSLINEINDRYKKEIAVREEREKHLSPEMLEIKKVSEAFLAMEKQMEELKLQNDILIKKLEAQTQAKRNAELKHEQFLNEIDALSDDELLSFFERKNSNTDDCSDGQEIGRGRRR